MKKQISIIIIVVGYLACATLSGQDLTHGAKLDELKAAADKNRANIELWLQLGQMQFAAARGGQPAALEEAKAAFEHILQIKPDEPRALVWHGAILSMKAGNLFQSGKLEEGQKLLTQGFDQMDRGVKALPGDPELRRLRGHTNLRVPEFLGRTALGVEDFELVATHPSFEKIGAGEKAQIYQLLGVGYSRVAKPDLAQQMWQKAVALAPESQAGKEAQKRLDLATAKEGSKPGSRTERLTEIPDTVSPIMVVATIAFAPDTEKNATSTPGTLSNDFDEMFEAMKKARGFMGVRLLQSGDTPPMFVAISWWKDRNSLVDWYYHPAHQKMVKSFNSGSVGSAKGLKDAIRHIGIQFYSPLRGGLTLGENFGPTQKPVE